MKRPDISVVVPLFNEEENLEELHKRLTGVFQKLEMTGEIILVDDGSTDGSLAVIRDLAGRDPSVRGISLSRNYGHQVCLTAGLDAARGDRIVTMDADLQDPPEVIAEMVARQNQGFDIVYGIRRQRGGETLFKRTSAALFYRTLRLFTNIDIPLDAGDFRLISRRALDGFLALRERNRFNRGLFSWIGFKQTGVEFDRPPRHKGKTKYPLRKMIRFAVDGITSFSTLPLQFATWLGFLSAFAGFLYSIRVVYEKIQTPESVVPGWASLSILILFFGGIQLMTLGIIGEYIGRVFEEVKRRPLYFVKEQIRFEDAPGVAHEKDDSESAAGQDRPRPAESSPSR